MDGSGPHRQLLLNRRLGGKVLWKDDNSPIGGALVEAYDMDIIGTDSMGSATVQADGGFVIVFTDKDWDSCCGAQTNPDIKLKASLHLFTLLENEA